MNLIDHYNCAANPHTQAVLSPHSQWLQQLNPRPSEAALPLFLVYMRSHLEKEYPHARVCIFAEEPEDEGGGSQHEPQPEEKARGVPLRGRLVAGVVHPEVRWGRFQTYNEVAIDLEAQSVLVKGALMLNNQLVRLRSQEQILMALRKAAALNARLSPLRIAVSPIAGSLELASCSYLDVKFPVLNNSEKNTEYFTLRIGFILALILAEISVLLCMLEEGRHYEGRLLRGMHAGEEVALRMENTLHRAHTRPAPHDYASRAADLQKHHLRLPPDLTAAIRALGIDADAVEYRKTPQIRELAGELYDQEAMGDLATGLERQISFRVYSRIQIEKEVAPWQDLGYRGNCRIEHAPVRFSLLPEPTRRPRREGEEADSEEAAQLMREITLEARLVRKCVEKSVKLEREKAVVRSLRGKCHPNIGTFLESASPKDSSFLYALFEENQSLEQFTEKCSALSFFQRLFMLEQAAKGLLFLHNAGILHLDYKPANLIVGRKLIVKICDFGESCARDQLKNHRFGVTFPFAAPEAYNAQAAVTEKADIYGLGVTIFYCLFSQHVWGSIGSRTNFISSLKAHRLLPTLLPEAFRDHTCSHVVRMLVQLCLRCISPYPDDRPTLAWLVTFLQEARNCLEQLHYK